MNCRGASRRLSAYIDNDLSPGIRQSVDEHLQSCRSCKQKLAELRAIVIAAHNMPPLKVSGGFKERVLAVVYEGRGSPWRSETVRLRLAMAGAGFVTAAALVFFLAGPPFSSVTTSGPGEKSQITTDSQEQVVAPAGLDFTDDPRIKIESFPVPEGAASMDLIRDDSLFLADSTSRIDEFILPVVEKSREKVNVNVTF
ncbi:MAG: zf-HC2 domain-containing protein [candidate division Zixibacteria bacterium]